MVTTISMASSTMKAVPIKILLNNLSVKAFFDDK